MSSASVSTLLRQLFLISVLMGGTVQSISHARADEYRLPDTHRWLVISSRKSVVDAVELGERMEKSHPDAQVFRADNNNFHVTLGAFPVAEGQRTLARLKSSGDIPADSYLASGRLFVSRVWATQSWRARNPGAR